jgi:NAD(P)-dependent dehydrogenase (short-subunit alcohol dehydrogenase family)
MSGFKVCIIAVGFALTTHFIRPVFEVHDKGVIVITGASSGIGKSATIKLASLGYHVVAGVRKQSDGDAIIDSVNDQNVAKFIIPTIIDVTDNDSIDAAVIFAQKVGKVVGVVCNAGVSSGSSMPVEFGDREKDNFVFSVNYFGLKETAVRFLPLLRENHGRLLTVGSIAGTIANAFGQPYSVSKHMVRSLSDSLRHELAPLGVSVSRIEPGFVSTPILVKNGMSTPVEQKPFNLLPKEKRDVYQSQFDKTTVPLRKMALGASSTDETDNAIVHALTAIRPKPVYHPGAVGGIPAKIPGFLFKFLEAIDPSWVDLLVSAMEG